MSASNCGDSHPASASASASSSLRFDLTALEAHAREAADSAALCVALAQQFAEAQAAHAALDQPLPPAPPASASASASATGFASGSESSSSSSSSSSPSDLVFRQQVRVRDTLVMLLILHYRAQHAQAFASANEELDDVATGDLKYALLPYYLGDVCLRIVDDSRATHLRASTVRAGGRAGCGAHFDW